jgi:hypothetical protein
VILEDDGAHASALGKPGQVNRINASWNRIGSRVRMDVDYAIKGLALRPNVDREKREEEQECNWNSLHVFLPSEDELPVAQKGNSTAEGIVVSKPA